MSYASTNTDRLATYKPTPDINDLAGEFRRSLYNVSGGYVTQTDDVDNTRYALWSSQSDDGKKWSTNMPDGEQAFPYEGASDVRIRLVDSTINEIVANLCTGFERAKISASGLDFTDAPLGESATTLAAWLRDSKLRFDLGREAELLAQYAHTYGWSVLHVGWDQKLSTRMQPITMEQVAQMAMQAGQQDPSSVIAMMPQMIMDPAQEEQAADIVSLLMPDMKIRDARQFVRDLRDTGTAEYEEEYVLRNLPSIAALRPFTEVIVPPETTDLQRARVIFRREFMTEVELRAKIIEEEWDKEFVEQAIQTQGKQYWLAGDMNSLMPPGLSYNGALRTDYLIEIVHAYAKQINDKGVPAIYYTVFSPLVGENLYAKHEPLDYVTGKYPFVEYRAERTRRGLVASRGVPEIAKTDQQEIKAQHDSMRDRTAFTTLPPIKVKKRIGMLNKIGPAQQLPVTASDDYQFLSPPASSIIEAQTVINMVESRHANYFGLTHASVSPSKAAIMQQHTMNNWFSTWSEGFNQMFQLCLQYMDPVEIERVTGSPLPQRLSEIAGQFDFVLKFDVRELDNEYVMKKLQAITQFVVPLDSGGVIDRNKLIQAIVAAISPDAAREMIVDQTGASQQMFRQVQSDIGMMMLGNEALYTENDPAAETKLQYAQQVMQSNQKAAQAAQGDPNFQQLFENYVKNLQMSSMQQKNAQVGRIGVTPVQQ